LLFVNDLPEWIVSSLKIFADVTKLWITLKSKTDSAILQNDLDNLIAWSNKWLLKFNPSKFKLMHIGHNLSTEYHMVDDIGRNVMIEETSLGKDLGIYISSDLKPSTQCAKAAGKARSVLAMVRRNFKKLAKEDFILIYRTYIRPHMEYCVQAWSPHLVKDIQTLESFQRTATKIVPTLRKLPYESRLQ